MSRNYNEEMAWRRLQDMQREMENRLLVDSGGPAFSWWLPRLAGRVWLLAGLGARRAPRWNPAVLEPNRKSACEDCASGANAA